MIVHVEIYLHKAIALLINKLTTWLILCATHHIVLNPNLNLNEILTLFLKPNSMALISLLLRCSVTTLWHQYNHQSKPTTTFRCKINSFVFFSDSGNHFELHDLLKTRPINHFVLSKSISVLTQWKCAFVCVCVFQFFCANSVLTQQSDLT